MTRNLLSSNITQNGNHAESFFKPISLWIKEAYKFLSILQCHARSYGYYVTTAEAISKINQISMGHGSEKISTHTKTKMYALELTKDATPRGLAKIFAEGILYINRNYLNKPKYKQKTWQMLLQPSAH